MADPGPVPHPMAASKMLAAWFVWIMGLKVSFPTLAADAIEGWHRWNEAWGEDLYHEDGILFPSSFL
ncbi:MAG: hypothetical protein CM1200mP27_09930 [Chloroflexota bacterium]|nr:MAG: hypothetical protein CM1200mP27_09930 [Chloroflexota bacterium]